MFAVYAYLASTLIAVTHVSPALVPIVFCVFGVGMTVGNVRHALAGRPGVDADDRRHSALECGVAGALSARGRQIYAVTAVVFMIGCGGGLGTALQTRLMDVAEDAQTLAAALNHSAFNTANAIGPWLGGLAIAHGYGWTSTGWVGAALALADSVYGRYRCSTTSGPHGVRRRAKTLRLTAADSPHRRGPMSGCLRIRGSGSGC